jgi:mitochondrial distribution and morphology protein 12
MSVDINWDTITGGPDGEALALKIRDFVHDKFQQIVLPRFIKSVNVHEFHFGSTCPEVEIKDISDPLPDFYEDDGDSSDDDSAAEAEGDARLPTMSSLPSLDTARANTVSYVEAQDRHNNRSHPNNPFAEMARAGTPGIPGGTSNFNYFHMPISGLSGAQTPLAAVASGTPFTPVGWPIDRSQSPVLNLPPARRLQQQPGHAHEHNDPSTRPSTANTLLTHVEYPPDNSSTFYGSPQKVADDPSYDASSPLGRPGMHNAQPTDLQVVARVKYSGDISLMLTAEILLDYPMPSFVGIPLKLSITGMTFDGVAIVAYIKKRMHFCFLDPEDADTLVGDHVMQDGPSQDGANRAKPKSSLLDLGLLKDIQIESEIGRQESGKQVLKNVGKVERFVLEQIRKIFEEEFVFPSFWTFLV